MAKESADSTVVKEEATDLSRKKETVLGLAASFLGIEVTDEHRANFDKALVEHPSLARGMPRLAMAAAKLAATHKLEREEGPPRRMIAYANPVRPRFAEEASSWQELVIKRSEDKDIGVVEQGI